MLQNLKILFLLQGIAFCGTGQTIFKPVFIDECSHKVISVKWWLKDTFSTYLSQNDQVEVPAGGDFFLFTEHDWERPLKVTLLHNKINSDTCWISALTFNQYIGYSEYLYCDSLANGNLKGIYLNGRTSMIGRFINGQVQDTLCEFYQNGQLSKLFVTNAKGWKSIRYVENGRISSSYDVIKRKAFEYYDSGNLKKMDSWSARYHHKIRAYDEKGNLTWKESCRHQINYDSLGMRIAEIHRKKILLLYTFFNRKLLGNNPFYKYTWKQYDTKGNVNVKFVFYHGDFMGETFPQDIHDIDFNSTDKMIIYQDGKEVYKIEIQELIGEKDQEMLLDIYRKDGKNWTKEKVVPLSEFYEIFDLYRN